MKKFSTILWGLFFILAGGLVIVNQMGYLTGISLFQLIFLIFAAAVLIQSLVHFNWFGVLFPLAIVIIVFAEPLGLQALTPWPILFAALFASIGLSIIFGKRNSIIRVGFGNGDEFEETIDVPDEEVVSCVANFSSSIKYVNSENFKKGNFRCHFGAMKVYFDNAILSEDGAIIYLDVSFGGVELYIPREWKVVNNCNCSLGGIEEKHMRRAVETDTKIVTITGNVSLGGVEITYV